MPKEAKASVAFFGGSIISSALAYITTPIYTRLLTADEYGQTAVWFTWYSLLGIIAMFSLSSGVFNNGMSDYPDRRDEYSLSMLGLSSLITLLFSLIFLGSYPWTKELLEMDFPLAVLMCVVFLFQPAYNYWMVRQRYEFKYKYPLLWTSVLAILPPLVSVICILYFPEHRLYSRIFGAEITLVVFYALFVVFLVKKGGKKINTKYWKSAFLFNLPLIPHYLSILALGGSDRIMISKMVGDAEAAYYSVAFSIAIAVSIVWSAINSSLVPYTYEHCKQRDFTPVAKLTSLLLAVFAYFTLFASLIAPEMIRIMATPEYMEAIYVIPPIIIGVFFQVHYFIYANLVYYYKKPRYVMYASVTAATLNIILNYLFIPLYGYVAAAYTNMLAYVIQAVIDFFAMRKAVGFNIYNIKFIIGLSSVVIVSSLVVMSLYPLTLIRYLLIIVLTLLFFIYKNKLKQYFVALNFKN